MAPVPTNRVYEEYDPPSDLVTEDGCDTILLYLPGYRKEQLRVQLTTSRILKISGERQIGDNKWRRFSKEYPVPTNCETKEITARFEGGILYIRQPKTITPAPAAPEVQPADKAKTAAEAPRPSPLKQKVPEVSLPQPPQHAPALPQPQPQPQPRPQPQPQPQSQPRSQPQPQPQPQLQPEPQKDFEEEKTKRNGSEYDAARKEQEDEFTKDEGRNGHLVSKARLPQMNDGGRGGFFQELQKPDNLKRLVISVLLVLGIGFYATYMFKSFAGDETDRVSEL